MEPISPLFTDLGGVLLTNGWDPKARGPAADAFGPGCGPPPASIPTMRGSLFLTSTRRGGIP